MTDCAKSDAVGTPCPETATRTCAGCGDAICERHRYKFSVATPLCLPCGRDQKRLPRR